MKVAAKARATRSQIVSAIQVWEQLNRGIDNDAEESIRFTGQWYLEGARADWITTRGVQRTHAVDMVIRELKQWAFALETSSRMTTHGNPPTNDYHKARPTPCNSKVLPDT